MSTYDMPTWGTMLRCHCLFPVVQIQWPVPNFALFSKARCTAGIGVYICRVSLLSVSAGMYGFHIHARSIISQQKLAECWHTASCQLQRNPRLRLGQTKLCRWYCCMAMQVSYWDQLPFPQVYCFVGREQPNQQRPEEASAMTTDSYSYALRSHDMVSWAALLGCPTSLLLEGSCLFW